MRCAASLSTQFHRRRARRTAGRGAAHRRHSLHCRIPQTRRRKSSRRVSYRTASPGSVAMNTVLAAWNEADESPRRLEAMLACCAARRWAEAMVALRPFSGVESLSLTADEVWSTMEEPDWMEAFAAHPRIGERKATTQKTTAAAWSEQEQSSTAKRGTTGIGGPGRRQRTLRAALRLHVYCLCNGQKRRRNARDPSAAAEQ